ncbi:MAG TPA: glycosyltransferase N-terminal domain-containing protein [Chryseosolibacter sp.]
MILVYNLAISVLSVLLRAASLFHSKAKAFVTGRRNILHSIKVSLAGNRSPVIWIHCASLGEFEQGRPIVEALKENYAAHKILLTFFSPSGFEVRKNFPLADYVFYLPWDTRANARQLVEAVDPVMAIFVKYEFWYHYAAELKKKNIPLLSVSSIFRTNQIFFRSYGALHRRILRNFTWFFVQNHESIKLLNSIGLTNCTRTGDTRFDRVRKIQMASERVPLVEAFKNNQKVFVVGSSWQEDLDLLIPFINENRLKFIIAPHEIKETSILSLENALQVPSIRYSRATGKNLEDVSVLIIDNIGMLSKLYRYGEFAYIGGAFGKGLHNILEAASNGIPILFGNRNYEKFQEAVDLINRGGAFAVADFPDLKAKYEMLNVPESFLLACEVTRQYVQDNLGATEKIMEYCKPILGKNFKSIL